MKTLDTASALFTVDDKTVVVAIATIEPLHDVLADFDERPAVLIWRKVNMEVDALRVWEMVVEDYEEVGVLANIRYPYFDMIGPTTIYVRKTG